MYNRNIKYGISAVCIAALVLLTSGCKRDELETVKAQDDVIKFAFGDGSLPELKTGADGTSGESRAIALEGDIDGIMLYRTERASDSFFGYVSETKGTPVTTANLSSLYMDDFFTTAYDAEHKERCALSLWTAMKMGWCSTVLKGLPIHSSGMSPKQKVLL